MSNHSNTDSAKKDSDHGDDATPSQPAFRFVQMQSAAPSPYQPSDQAAIKPAPSAQLIDKASYFDSANTFPEKITPEPTSTSHWSPQQLRPVPAFYPLEKSSRLIEDESASEVASRLADCLRTLSVHALYDNQAATASLLTSENVEMHLSLWHKLSTPSKPSSGVVVELQRRKGDSIAFHRYSRSILDAAVGDLEYLPDLDDALYSKKVQRLLSMELKNQQNQEHENAIIAIEIAHGLIMKDRMDARQLGLESLCLLTDPRKTGYITSVLCSHVILLGSTQGVEIPGVEQGDSFLMDEGPFQEIREAILSLVQFSRISEEDETDEDDIVTNPESDHMTLLHNLALAVLANALDVIENPERYDAEPEHTTEDSKPRSRLRTASSTDVTNEFLQQTEEFSKKELLSTLIAELGKAHTKPHNAVLSAKCLGSMCRASDEAKERAKELGAKTVVSTALDVGVRTHLKLETECKKVVKVLASASSTTTTSTTSATSTATATSTTTSNVESTTATSTTTTSNVE